LVALCTSAFVFGSFDAWIRWKRVAAQLAALRPPHETGNFALPYANVVGAVALLAALVVLWSSRARSSENDVALVTGLGSLLYLLGANLVWYHYMILVLPLCIGLIAPSEHVAVRIAGALATSFMAVDPWVPILGIRTAAGETSLVYTAFAMLYLVPLLRFGVRSLAPADVAARR
jgi:hypothetical protein